MEERLYAQPNVSISKVFTIRALLNEPDIDINMQDEAGDRPLDIALHMQYSRIVQLLIQHGARFDHLKKNNKLSCFFR